MKPDLGYWSWKVCASRAHRSGNPEGGLERDCSSPSASSRSAAAAAITTYALLNRAPLVEVTRVMAAQSPSGENNPVVLNATGYVVAHHEIQVASKVSGQVAWIGVDEGSAVKKRRSPSFVWKTPSTVPRSNRRKGNLANLDAKLLELEHGSRPQESPRHRRISCSAGRPDQQQSLHLKRKQLHF